MLTAALLVAADAAEKSKTPFYVAGAALAVFAVLLSAFGISRPDFPGRGAERGLLLTVALLVAAAMVTAVATG